MGAIGCSISLANQCDLLIDITRKSMAFAHPL